MHRPKSSFQGDTLVLASSEPGVNPQNFPRTSHHQLAENTRGGARGPGLGTNSERMMLGSVEQSPEMRFVV